MSHSDSLLCSFSYYMFMLPIAGFQRNGKFCPTMKGTNGRRLPNRISKGTMLRGVCIRDRGEYQ